MKVYKGTLIDEAGKIFPCTLKADDYITEARERIEGWIEQHLCEYLGKKSFMLMDEEAKLRHRPFNPRASAILGDIVAGPVIIIPCKKEEAKNV